MNKEELKEVACVGSSDYEILDNAYDYIDKLESNWKELKEWLIEAFMLYIPMVADNSQMTKVLNKMNEIEEDKKDDNSN